MAGLIVGAISLYAGVGAWASLLRVGIAFLVFGLIGLGLLTALKQGAGGPTNHKGRRFDRTTPDDPDSSIPAPKTNDVNSDILK